MCTKYLMMVMIISRLTSSAKQMSHDPWSCGSFVLMHLNHHKPLSQIKLVGLKGSLSTMLVTPLLLWTLYSLNSLSDIMVNGQSTDSSARAGCPSVKLTASHRILQFAVKCKICTKLLWLLSSSIKGVGSMVINMPTTASGYSLLKILMHVMPLVRLPSILSLWISFLMQLVTKPNYFQLTRQKG